MRRGLPASLSGQTLGVLVLALLASHVIGIAVYWLDRREAVTATEARDFAERVVGMVVLLRHLPAEWHEDIVRESDGRTFHVTLDATPDTPGEDLDEDLSAAVAQFIKDQFTGDAPQEVRVAFTATPFIPSGPTRAGRPAAALNEDTKVFLHISILLGEAGWLNFVGGMPVATTPWLMPASAYILCIILGIGAAAMWLVYRVTQPLTAFARAADRLGTDLRAEPLPETGPTEIAQVSRAFNAMQERLRRLVENRTQILAALSHDLKTPVTLVRLRAELMAESEEKDRILHTIGEMEAMIGSVLEFTRVTLLNEPPRNVDLYAMVGSICEDMGDAGADVALEPGGTVSYVCRRVSLKRALTNLIDNAVKYGGAVRVRVTRRDRATEVEIDDDGPGIPEKHWEDIFMPFYRLDDSRSEGAGGVGLGLSIAQTIIHGHGGQIYLENRAEGGLRVRVSLP